MFKERTKEVKNKITDFINERRRKERRVNHLPMNVYLINRGIERIEYALAVAETALFFRFVFLLFEGSNANWLVKIFYFLTTPLVLPFYGFFGPNKASGLPSEELETLAAMALWAILAWIAIGFMTLNKRRTLLDQRLNPQ